MGNELIPPAGMSALAQRVQEAQAETRHERERRRNEAAESRRLAAEIRPVAARVFRWARTLARAPELASLWRAGSQALLVHVERRPMGRTCAFVEPDGALGFSSASPYGGGYVTIRRIADFERWGWGWTRQLEALARAIETGEVWEHVAKAGRA